MSFPGGAEESLGHAVGEVWGVDTSEIVCHNNKHYTTITKAEEANSSIAGRVAKHRK